MEYITAHANIECTEQAAATLIRQLKARSSREPSLLLLYFSGQHDAECLRQQLAEAFPDTPLIGCSSCQVVQTEQGGEHGVAVAALYDPQGAFGVAGAREEEADVRQLLHQAMASCERTGELPQLVLLHTSPGREEDLLAQIDAELGGGVPVIGGSAADDTVSGDWQLCWQSGSMRDGLVLAVFYPDCELVFQFHSGYTPTAHEATVTEVEGREIISLDGMPAADRYQSWLGRPLATGPVLHESTFSPLARQIGEMYGTPYFKLSAPEYITERRGLRLFTNVLEGERLILMQGSESGILRRSLLAARIEPEYGLHQALYPIGALILFCAGYRLALPGAASTIANQLHERLGGAPYVMAFAFGEQGRLPQGGLAHGNLMLSSVIFCRGS